MHTAIFIPPVRKATGGVAVLLQIASILRTAGYPVSVVPRESRDGAFYEAGDLPVTPWEELSLSKHDVWLVPEGWVNALAPGLNAGARCVVYCQNWAYLFSALPGGVAWEHLPVHFLAVSHPVAWFIEQALGDMPPILRPGIDTKRFRPAVREHTGRIRVAYMPRKNKALADQIKHIVNARGQCPDIVWDPLENLDQDGVAARLQQAHIYLMTGFPEGCPLPPLEAMACGCLPVGFSGFGGWDYMRQAAPNRDFTFSPWWPLRPAAETDWEGNGLWVADGDVLAAALALETAAQWIRGQDEDVPGPLANTLAHAQRTAESYSLQHQAASVRALWDEAAANRLFIRS